MWKEGKKRRAIIGKMNNNLSMPTKHPDKIVEQLKEFQGEMEQFSCDGILTDMIEIVKRGGVDAD